MLELSEENVNLKSKNEKNQEGMCKTIFKTLMSAMMVLGIIQYAVFGDKNLK